MEQQSTINKLQKYHQRKRFTLSEVLDVLEDDEVFQSAQIFLQPPGEDDKSDEDSDEEEGGDLNHLPRDLLQSNIDFTINYGNEITNTLEEEVVETVPHEVIKTNVDEISVEWDEDTFNECKKTMRQFIPLLKKLKKMDKNEFETVLIEIGAHIESVLEKYDDPLKWKNTLWSFVAWFTTSSVRELLNLYEEVGQNANVEYESSGLSSDSEISTDEEEAEDNDNLLKLSPPSNNFFKKWSKKGTSFTQKTFPDPPIPPEYNGPVTPASIFDLFFYDELIQHIVVNTNLYANRDHGDHLFSTTSEEIRRFIAILLLSGYNRLPRRRMYWEVADDVYNKQVADAIPRNRFELLMKYLHLADNEKPITGDKMWKIRPFYDKMNERCVRYAPFQSDLSVDESMLPYFGRNSSKQRYFLFDNVLGVSNI